MVAVSCWLESDVTCVISCQSDVLISGREGSCARNMAGYDDKHVTDLMHYTKLLDKLTVTLLRNITYKLPLTRSKQSSLITWTNSCVKRKNQLDATYFII